MKKQLIALTLLVTLGATTFSTPVIAKANDMRHLDGSIVDLNQESDEIVIFEQDVFLTEYQLEELKHLLMMERSFSTDHMTYIQKSVTKQESINIKNTYNRVIGRADNTGKIVTGSVWASYISNQKKYENIRSFIRTNGAWAGNILSVMSFVSGMSIARFTNKLQDSIDKMNNRDRLLFRIDSHNLQDSTGTRFSLRIQRR